MLLEDYLAQNDICVLSRPLPLSVRGFVFRRGMGYCIVLNALSQSYCEHSQRRTLRHELLHLQRGDDSSALPVALLESQLHYTPGQR